jgi:hypothetical protein
MANAGWYPDPLGRAQVRYFDGAQWSQWAADNGQSRLDVEAPIAGLPDPPSSPPPGMPPPPPGPGGAWAPSGAVRPRFQPLQGLATALTWLLALSAVSAVTVLASQLARLDAYNRVVDGDFSAINDFNDADDAVGATRTIFFLLEIAIFVLVIIFLFRAVKNTVIWTGTAPRWAAGWAIGGWFIPLASFVIPFLVFLEVWKRSAPGDPRSGAPGRGLLWCWWLAYVVGQITVLLDPTGDLPTRSEIRARDTVNSIGAGFLAVAAVLMILVVRRLAAWQQQQSTAVAA